MYLITDCDLSSSNLRGSDLRYVIGNGREVKSLQIGTYFVSYHKDILNIGATIGAIENLNLWNVNPF